MLSVSNPREAACNTTCSIGIPAQIYSFEDAIAKRIRREQAPQARV